MARLILSLNNKVLNNFTIAQGQQMNIGRHKDNHIVIDNMAVSGHHAMVRLDGKKLIVTDLGSRNGTYINNEKITESQVAHQDWITIGKHILIVDLHESLSLEASARELMAAQQQENFGDQTMVLTQEETQSKWVGFDYLSFLSAVRDDLELSRNEVSIGKNPDAQIKITGMWAILAGTPSATITKQQEDYFINYIGGMLKPKVNGAEVKGPTKLNHQDIIKVGPVEVQIRRVRRPSM